MTKCKYHRISLCFTKSFNSVTSKYHHVHALWIFYSQAYRKMCLAKMNYVFTQFPRGLISVHIRNVGEKAIESC